MMKKGGLIFMASLSSTTAIIQQLSIQCYGDSLTAGFKLDGPFHPYAIALSAALKSAGILEPDVRHRGMPGWTAKELLNEKDSLESLDTLLQTKPAEFTIILAGTNDLGFGMDELEIVENIWGLHEIAHRHKSVTIAVSVPESKYQATSPEIAQKCARVNDILRDRCASAAGYCVFVECPVQWGKEELWEHDGLHFSAQGYDALGSYLAPVILSLKGDSSSSNGNGASAGESDLDGSVAACDGCSASGGTAAQSTNQNKAAIKNGGHSWGEAAGSIKAGNVAAERRATMVAAAEARAAASRHHPKSLSTKPGKGGNSGEKKKFPAHWGEPPHAQTRDMRPWPGGYGAGSGTVAKWIQLNMDQDTAGAGAGL